jgi:hypothetical protein
MVDQGIEPFRVHKEYPVIKRRKKTIEARPRCDLSIFGEDTEFEKLLNFRESRKREDPIVPEAVIELSLDYGKSHFEKDGEKLITGWPGVQPQPLKFIVHIVRMFWVNNNLSPRSWLDEEKLLDQRSKEYFDSGKIDYIRCIRGPINEDGRRKLSCSDKVKRPHWRDIEILKGKASDRVFCVEKDELQPNSREASVCRLCGGSFPAGLQISFSRAKRRRAV